MPDFNIDSLKKQWQEHEIAHRYGNEEILDMLNRKSQNYVKYIFCICLAEFLIFSGITAYYMFFGEDSASFLNILEKLGIRRTPQISEDIAHLYFVMKIISLAVTAFFLALFYQNFRSIKVESNLKKFILQIMRFKKTVDAFILTNMLLLIIFTVMVAAFVLSSLSSQQIQMRASTLGGFLVGIFVAMLAGVGIIWLYYRLLYGIIIRRLTKNLAQLREVEEPEGNS